MHLPLLKKTDIQWLVEAFGDIQTHLCPREVHAKVWIATVVRYAADQCLQATNQFDARRVPPVSE